MRKFGQLEGFFGRMSIQIAGESPDSQEDSEAEISSRGYERRAEEYVRAVTA
jgi:hypothetical protein